MREGARNAVKQAALRSWRRKGAVTGEQCAVLDARGAGGDAAEAAEAAVNVRLRLCGGQAALQHGFHQHDAAARRVGFVAQQLVGGAGGQAKAAMHTRADCVGHGWRLCAKLFNGNVVLHLGLPLAR